MNTLYRALLTTLLIITAYTSFAQAPVISKISASSASINSSITISGINFNSVAAQNAVYFGAVKGHVNTASATQLNVTVPTGATYGKLGVVNTQLGLVAYSPQAFTPKNNGQVAVNSTDFSAPAEFGDFDSPTGVAHADIDGDGNPDMVILNYNSFVSPPYASVFRNISTPGNIGPAAYAPRVNLQTDGEPRKIQFADLNGDSKPELIILNSNRITVYINRCIPGNINAASFEKRTIGVDKCNQFTLADMDGDGKIDIVTNITDSSPSNAFYIFKNTSSGGDVIFDREKVFPGNLSSYVFANDFDADGKNDLLTVTTDGNLELFQNQSTSGDLSFVQKGKIRAFEGNAVSAKMADMDDDGKPELLLSYSNYSVLNKNLLIFKNTSQPGAIGTGSFASPVRVFLNSSRDEITLVDMNYDGRPDVFVIGDKLSVMLNNSSAGQITFSSKVDLENLKDPSNVSYAPYYFSVCDVDGDGNPDITALTGNKLYTSRYTPKAAISIPAPPVISSIAPATGLNGSDVTINGKNFNAGTVANTVYFGATKATVKSASSTQIVTQAPIGSTYKALSVLNTATHQLAYSTVPFVSTLPKSLPLTDSTYKSSYAIATYGPTTNVGLGDLDGDGKVDFVFDRGDRIIAYLNKTTVFGEYDFAINDLGVVGTYNATFKLEDVDGDGKLDIVVSSSSNLRDTYINILLNKSTPGNLIFDTPIFMEKVGTTPILADMNGDGKLDIVGVDGYGGRFIGIMLNTSVPGKVSFSNTTQFDAVLQAFNICDFDGDQKPDMILFNGKQLVAYKNTSDNGGLSFENKMEIDLNIPNFAIMAPRLTIGDVDGDGRADVLFNQGANETNVRLFLNTSTAGNLTFGAERSIPVGAIFYDIKFADLNGDGKIELAALSKDESTKKSVLNVLQNTSIPGNAAFSDKIVYPVDNTPASLNIADVDGDGKADVALTFTNGPSDPLTTIGVRILKNGLTLLPLPTITANGPLTFFTGNSVLFTASPSTGYTYKWKKNNVEIANATLPTLTVTEEGDYSVNISLANGENRTSAPVYVKTVPRSGLNVAAINVTCKGSANGSVAINTDIYNNYKATITGNSVSKTIPFTQTASFTNLAAGSYEVCITIDGRADFSYCSKLVITEPKDLALYSSVNDKTNTIELSLNGGTEYYIQLNNKSYTTTGNSITLPLEAGDNKIIVTTDKPCQGIIEKTITLSGLISPYPVPFQNTLNVNIGNTPAYNIELKLYAVNNGKLVYTTQSTVAKGVLQVNTTDLKTGVYSLHLKMNGIEKIFKIIKK